MGDHSPAGARWGGRAGQDTTSPSPGGPQGAEALGSKTQRAFMGLKPRRGRRGVPSARALALTACLACRKALYAIENKITIKKQPAIVGLIGFVPRNCQGSFAMHLTTLIVIGALYAIFFFPYIFAMLIFFFLLIYRFSVKAKKTPRLQSKN